MMMKMVLAEIVDSDWHRTLLLIVVGILCVGNLRETKIMLTTIANLPRFFFPFDNATETKFQSFKVYRDDASEQATSETTKRPGARGPSPAFAAMEETPNAGFPKTVKKPRARGPSPPFAAMEETTRRL